MSASINRWGMLAAHVCINFVLGGVYAFSYFKTPLMAQYHWDPATLALAFSINMGIIPLPMIWGGRMIDNGKGKQAIVIGGILFSLGFILSGFVDNLPMLFLTYGVIAGLGSGLAFTGNLNNILKFFPDRRGLPAVSYWRVLASERYFAPAWPNILWRKLMMLVGRCYIWVLFIWWLFLSSSSLFVARQQKIAEELKPRHWIKTIGTC